MTSSIFGLSEQALQLTEQRSILLTNNIVNSSTPKYKARDMNFHEALKNVNQPMANLAKTNSAHLSTTNTAEDPKLLYRVPMQTRLDGNTVDSEIERKNFLENSLRYQVSLTFVNNKSSELMKSIKGD